MAGTHEDYTREVEQNRSSDRNFGFVFAGAFTVLTFWPLVRHRPVRLWALPIALLFFLVALAKPSLLAPLNLLWAKVGRLLQRIVHPIVMGIMFYLIFTPAGLLLRWLGKDLLHLKYEPDAETYWISRVPPGPNGPSMSHQF